MSGISDERFHQEIVDRTAALADVVCADSGHPVPTCPGWTFAQLGTHVGRGHRWAAEIVATRSPDAISPRDVSDGRAPADPGDRVRWLNAGATGLVDVLTSAGDDPVWTFTGTRPAAWWARRRAHEIVVHLADAQLASGQDASIPPDLAVDGVDEWLGLLASRPELELGDGRTLHFHATDHPGEWTVRGGPSGIAVETGHHKADFAARGPAARLLLVLTRRLPADDPSIEVFGDEELFAHWLANTLF